MDGWVDGWVFTRRGVFVRSASCPRDDDDERTWKEAVDTILLRWPTTLGEGCAGDTSRYSSPLLNRRGFLTLTLTQCVLLGKKSDGTACLCGMENEHSIIDHRLCFRCVRIG